MTANHLFSWQACVPAQCFQLGKSDENVLLGRRSRGYSISAPCWESAAMILPSRCCYWANQSFWAQREWQDFGSPKDEPPELGLLLDHSNPGWPLSFLSCLPHPSSRDAVSSLSSKMMSFVSTRSLQGTTVPIRPQKKEKILCFLPYFEHHLKRHILFGTDYSAKSRSPLIRDIYLPSVTPWDVLADSF